MGSPANISEMMNLRDCFFDKKNVHMIHMIHMIHIMFIPVILMFRHSPRLSSRKVFQSSWAAAISLDKAVENTAIKSIEI